MGGGPADFDRWRRVSGRTPGRPLADGLDLAALAPAVDAARRELARRSVVDDAVRYECSGCGQMLAYAYRYVGADSETWDISSSCPCPGRPLVPEQAEHEAAVRRALARPRDRGKRFDGRTATVRVRRG